LLELGAPEHEGVVARQVPVAEVRILRVDPLVLERPAGPLRVRQDGDPVRRQDQPAIHVVLLDEEPLVGVVVGQVVRRYDLQVVEVHGQRGEQHQEP
jgi:hypothetical protein